MSDTDDLGFVAPEILPGAAAAAEVEPEADPFEELEAEAPEPTEEEEAVEGETFSNLEEEYRTLASLKKRRDELKDAHSQASAEYEAQRGRMMRAMKAQGTKQFKSTLLEKGACHFSSAYQVKIKDPTDFIPWVKKHAEELLSVNSRTLGKYVRVNYKNKGVPIDDPSFPPGLEVSEHDTLTVSVPKE